LGKSDGFDPNEILYVSVRPEKTRCATAPVEGFSLGGIVRENIYLGNFVKTIITLTNGQFVKIHSPVDEPPPPVGSIQYVYWNIKDAVMIYTPAANEVVDQLNTLDLSSLTNTEEGQ
jgi:spermidine/putrescine transport system ATP-binding protein